MIRPFVFKSINDRMFQQTTAGEVSLYHITQLYRKVCMCLCRTEYQYPPCALPFTRSNCPSNNHIQFFRPTTYNGQSNKWLHILLQPVISPTQFSKWLVIGPATQCHWYCSHVDSSPQYGPMDRRNVILECAQVIGKIKGNNWLYLVIYDLNILYCIYISIYFT